MPTITGIAIRPLTSAELSRVTEIDVAESGTTVYRQVGRRLEGAQGVWHRPRRRAEAWNRYIEEWRLMLADGGTAIGAFAAETLMGIAVLRPRLTARMAQLAALFVRREYRQGPVAQRLTEEVVRLARQTGATALYVSATPSASAIGFYLSQGFAPPRRSTRRCPGVSRMIYSSLNRCKWRVVLGQRARMPWGGFRFCSTDPPGGSCCLTS